MHLKSYSEHRSQTAIPAINLIVRPDQANFHLSVSVETDSATVALPLLRRAAQRLEELLTPHGAKLEVTDLALPQESGKLSNSPLLLHGTLILPLGTDLTFWERAQKLAQIDDLLRALVSEGKKQKPAIELRRDLPVFVVAVPEHHREALVKRLHERARSLAGSTKSVLLKQLQVDRPVVQRPLGLESVELSLPIDGVGEVLIS